MNIYQQQILDHYHNPRHSGKLEDYSHSFKLENLSCGDTITVYLQVVEDKIVKMGYDAEGCAISIASASMLSEEIIGKSITDIEKMTTDDMMELLGIELTPSRIKCADLALQATKKAASKQN